MTAQTGRTENEGRESLGQSLEQFLTGLIIPPFTDIEDTGQSAGLE